MSPSLALARTHESRARWEETLDHNLRADPHDAVLRVKWKTSHHGGRTWAAPSATQAQLAAVQRTRHLGATDPGLTTTATLEVDGPLGFQPGEVITLLMEVVAHHAGIPLRPTQQGRRGGEHPAWFWLAGEDPSAPPGRVRLLLQDADQVQAVIRAVHGRAIQVGSDLVAVDVQSDLIQVDEVRQGNGRGAPPRSGR